MSDGQSYQAETFTPSGSSSDEDDDAHQAQDSNPNTEDTKTYLGPLRRAKLYHLLSRVPTTMGTLRRGDVARVSGFAVEHAYAAEEIVEIMTWAQLGQHHKPVAFANIDGFWNPMIALLDHMKKQGFIHHDLNALVIDDVQKILEVFSDN